MAKDIRQQVIDAIAKAASDNIKKDYNITQKQLQNKAKDFLSNYDILSKEENHFSGKLLKLAFQSKKLDIEKIEEKVLEEKRVESDIAKAKFLLAFRFNDYLDMYRKKMEERIGLYVQEVYNDSTKEYILKSYEIPLIDLVKMSEDKTGKLKLSNTNLKRYENNIFENTISSEHTAEAKQAYNGVRNRVEQYFKKAKITDVNKQKGGYLLQRIGNKQGGAKLANQGTLAEGYFSYLLDDHVTNLTKLCQQPKGSSPYYSHLFIKEFYEDYLSGVTNLSAIVEEDVKFGNKEYAVKKYGAELPDLKQYVTLAKYIINTPQSPVDIEKAIKSQLNKESPINPEVDLKDIADKEVQKFIKQVEKEIK